MYETSNLMTWPLETLMEVSHAIDLAIKEYRDHAIQREDLIRTTSDPSDNLMNLWIADIDRSKTKLDCLIEGKAAVLGVIRYVESQNKILLP